VRIRGGSGFGGKNGERKWGVGSRMVGIGKKGAINSASDGKRYNYFLTMEQAEQMGIFFEEKHTETLQEHNCKDEPLP
jgi:hypothetical protein